MPILRRIDRRCLFRTALALAYLCVAPRILGAAEALVVEVRETAGIARFGYPVTGQFEWPDERQTPFRLIQDGRPVAAQFSRIDEAGQAARWEVDFNVDLGPFESRTLSIEPTAARSENPMAQSLTVARDEGKLRIRRPGLDFVLPENPFALLHAVKSPREDYLLPDSPGVFVRDREGKTRRFVLRKVPETSAVQILKAGPLCAAVQFEGVQEPSAGESAKLAVRLDFPRSKSWVRAECAVDDAKQEIAALGADFHLRLAPTKARPTIVDFGAPSSVYTTLQPPQIAIFRASPRAGASRVGGRIPTAPWEVTRGVEGKMAPYVVALADDVRPVEGWAHVMDERLCTAIAVDRFGQSGVDRIEAAADGRLRIWREFDDGGAAQPGKPKALVFWLHFVPSPPQIGAVTSPQSMQSPPEVRVFSR